MSKKTVFSVVLWLAALACCLMLADHVMRRDDGERKYGGFFAEKKPFDVLFMGTSRVLDAVQPMELWRDYGYATYNLGYSSECLEMTECVLKTALDHNKPKVVMIDVYYVNRRIDDAWTYPYRHAFFDEIPLSKTKIEMVKATLPESEWLEFLMPFSLYHGRWDELLSGKAARVVDSETYMMGSELRAGRADSGWTYERTTAMDDTPMPGKDALRRMVALCRDHGVEPVLMALPAPMDEKEQMAVNSVQLIADEMDVPFLNFLDVEPLPVDFESDMYDHVGHMNPDGAAKLTAYLGRWLSENYSFEDKRGQAGYEHWDENLRKYEEHWTRVWGAESRLK